MARQATEVTHPELQFALRMPVLPEEKKRSGGLSQQLGFTGQPLAARLWAKRKLPSESAGTANDRGHTGNGRAGGMRRVTAGDPRGSAGGRGPSRVATAARSRVDSSSPRGAAPQHFSAGPGSRSDRPHGNCHPAGIGWDGGGGGGRSGARGGEEG